MLRDMKEWFVRHMGWVIGGVVLLGLYWWMSNPLLVTVTGVGEVSVPASRAVVSFTLSEADASPVVAVVNVKDKAERMRQLLVENGMNADEIVESQVQVVPAGLVTSGATGYQASMTMGGKTVNVGNVGNLAAVLYEKGASLVSQPVLTVEDQDTLEKQAYDKAMADATKQVNTLALKHLRLIRRLAAVTQQTSPLSGTVSSRSAQGQTETDGAGSTLMGSDSVKVTKTVTVTYRMW